MTTSRTESATIIGLLTASALLSGCSVMGGGALAGGSALIGNLVVLGVTVGIFFGTLGLGRSTSASRSATTQSSLRPAPTGAAPSSRPAPGDRA